MIIIIIIIIIIVIIKQCAAELYGRALIAVLRPNSTAEFYAAVQTKHIISWLLVYGILCSVLFLPIISLWDLARPDYLRGSSPHLGIFRVQPNYLPRVHHDLPWPDVCWDSLPLLRMFRAQPNSLLRVPLLWSAMAWLSGRPFLDLGCTPRAHYDSTSVCVSNVASSLRSQPRHIGSVINLIKSIQMIQLTMILNMIMMLMLIPVRTVMQINIFMITNIINRKIPENDSRAWTATSACLRWACLRSILLLRLRPLFVLNIFVLTIPGSLF